ncbi:DUF2017 family protein [Microbacterium sp. No. 7]|uniref:DUF2017 family protein n=1 Tax=Microbacterium sp. No. 7 TaxID=1714373 RepID=UPI0006D01699|nr:DUF2017 family protein [Microbacterium sp. No. 7]ALJ20280.1 hypothetical protein AOA12_10300 [Microbacterium sp. No. 7]
MTSVELTRVEAAHLADLVRQFTDLLDTAVPTDDAAFARLAPDAYPDDAAAAREFRRFTEIEALQRRRAAAERMLGTLPADPDDAPADVLDADDALHPFVLTLGAEDADAWLRTLSAIRLVLASRLGIETNDEHDPADPRFTVYDWLGYRLDRLVQAMS